jgi:hypothetical protein
VIYLNELVLCSFSGRNNRFLSYTHSPQPHWGPPAFPLSTGICFSRAQTNDACNQLLTTIYCLVQEGMELFLHYSVAFKAWNCKTFRFYLILFELGFVYYKFFKTYSASKL